MKKGRKAALIVGAFLMAIGAVLMLIGRLVSSDGFAFPAVFDYGIEEKTYEISESLDSVNVDVLSYDVELAPVKGGNARVECRYREGVPFKVNVKDGTLEISAKQVKKVSFFSVAAGKTGVTVYLPAKVYEEVSIKTASGDVKIDGTDQTELKVAVASGDVDFKNGEAGTVEIVSASGDINIYGVSVKNTAESGLKLTTASGDIKVVNAGSGSDLCFSDVDISTASGDVKIYDCDSADYDIKTVSGDISATIRKPKKYTVKTTSGDVNIPEQTGTGEFKAKTTSGDVRIQVSDDR